MTETNRGPVEAALQILGIRNLLLGIHDTAFPARSQEDIGCGTPYSRGAADFIRFARELGFNGLQLGPQGITTAANPSPYDGSLFSRNPLLLAPATLVRWQILDPAVLKRLNAERTTTAEHVDDRFARGAMAVILKEVHRRLERHPGGTWEACRRFRRRNAAWLLRDALYEQISTANHGAGWQHWPAARDRRLFAPLPGEEQAVRRRIRALLREHAPNIEAFCLTQYLLAAQHRLLLRRCRRLGIKLFGDCQIGFSDRDVWAAQGLFLADYRLGAPPSRTNPEGQPWNYPVFDPEQYELVEAGRTRPGPVLEFLRARIDKLFAEFDGLRIDHPHGLICPWVYRAGQADAHLAVRGGARLFASPDLPDHPGLARYAIVRPEQIDATAPRYADDWVADLDDRQVERYGRLFAEIVAAARDRRHGPREIICEVLSTQPIPLQRVMARYGQGRFRVTQKADLDRSDDVYRSENADPADWVMLGNHDTPTIWARANHWVQSGDGRRQAEYLAERLRIPREERSLWIERTAADAGQLAQAKFADLFVGPAQHVMVYFTDLFGLQQGYNQPGSVDRANWSLRVPLDYRHAYPRAAAENRALNLPAALALAIRARGPEFVAAQRELLAELETVAAAKSS